MWHHAYPYFIYIFQKIHRKTKEIPSYLIFDVDQKIISQRLRKPKSTFQKGKKGAKKKKSEIVDVTLLGLTSIV